MALLAGVLALAPGCAVAPVASSPGSSLHGQLRLVPREGVPRSPGSEAAYADPRYRDARLLDYARSRIEDESRTLNQAQSIQEFGDNDDFPLIKNEK